MSVKSEEQAQASALKKLEGGASDEYTPNTNASPPAVAVLPNPMSMQLAGYIIAGVTVVTGVLASKRGAHWLLQDQEISDLHLAVARVCEKYVSVDLDSPLMGLAAVVAAIAVPRVLVEVASQEKNKPVAEQGGDGDKS